MTNHEFLVVNSRLDDLIDHDITTCAACYQRSIYATIAREMLMNREYGEGVDTVQIWAERCRSAWESCKFYRAYQEAVRVGSDPKEVFQQKGWIP